MSKVCGSAKDCPFAPEQTTGGCPCADLCPGYCEPYTTYQSNRTEIITHGQLLYDSKTNFEEENAKKQPKLH